MMNVRRINTDQSWIQRFSRVGYRGPAAHAIILLCLPALLLFIEPDWIFSPVGQLDTWIYSGYFLNYPAFIHAFPDTYYGTRLGWIIPGYLAYNAFSPLVANYVLHLGVWYASVFAFYGIAARLLNRNTAFILALLLGAYYPFLREVGTDYVFGVSIAYFLVAFLCLVRAVRSDYVRSWVFLGGMAFAGMVHSNIYGITFAPVLGVYYLFDAWKKRGRAVISDGLFFVAGFAALTFVLGAINRVAGASFLFFLPSANFALSYGKKTNLYVKPIRDWIHLAYFLVYPLAALIMSLVQIPTAFLRESRRRRRISLLLSICVLIAFAMMVFWHVAGQPVFQYSYYAAYLIPATFLGFAAVFAPALGRLTPMQALMVGIVCIACCIVLRMPGTSVIFHPGFLWMTAVTLLASLLLYAANFVLKRRASKALLAAGLLLLAGYSTSGMQYITRDGSQPKIDQYFSGKDAFIALHQGVRHVREFAPDARVLFWFNDGVNRRNGLALLFHSMAAHYLWGYSLINYNFPSTDDQSGARSARLGKIRVGDPGALPIVFFSSPGEERVFERARRALAAHDIEASLDYRKRVERPGISYEMTFIRAWRRSLLKTHRFVSSRNLLALSREKMSAPLQQSVYGLLGRSRFLGQAADGTLLMRPTSRKDHLTTPFLKLEPRAGRGGEWLRLRLSESPGYRPSSGCSVLIQDGQFRTLHSSGCRTGRPGAKEFSQLIRIPEGVRRIRVNLNSRDPGPTHLPAAIFVDQGRIYKK